MLSNLEANSNKINKVFRWVQADMEFAPPGSEHYMTASHSYYQNLLKWSDVGARNPLPIKDVANPSDSIQCIDHIFTPESSRNYLQEMKKFKAEGKSTHQRLLFHRTHEECVPGILEEKFDPDRTPIVGNDVSLQTRNVYGKGVYLSQSPHVALMYGPILIWCKTMMGETEKIIPSLNPINPDIPAEFDSRTIYSWEQEELFCLISNVKQILPYCIICIKESSTVACYKETQIFPLYLTDQMRPFHPDFLEASRAD